jgi:hypothetical protein
MVRMKGKHIITPFKKRMRCEVYTCKNMAGFSIGLRGHAPAYWNICRECLDEIVRQAGVSLYGEGWTPEEGLASIGKTPIEQELPEIKVAVDMPAGSLDEPVDGGNDDGNVPDPLSEEIQPEGPEELSIDPLSDESTDAAPASEENESEHADIDNFYVCKDCGLKFQKPSEKMEYISHRRTCPKKQEGE